jgi:hypothetical protein
MELDDLILQDLTRSVESEENEDGSNVTFDIWSPYDSVDAARVLINLLSKPAPPFDP